MQVTDKKERKGDKKKIKGKRERKEREERKERQKIPTREILDRKSRKKAREYSLEIHHRSRRHHQHQQLPPEGGGGGAGSPTLNPSYPAGC